MGDFGFYGTREDSLILIEQILKMRLFRLIADIGYRNDKIIEIQTFNDIPEVMAITCNYFLWSDQYSKYPIKLGEPNINNEMAIRQLESGPLICMHLPYVFEKDGKMVIGGGDIYSTPYFIDPYTKNQYSPPQELRKIFRVLKSTIQKYMEKRFWQPYKYSPVQKYVSQIEPVWIGKNAIELLNTEQYYLLVGKDSWFTYSDLLTSK